MTKKRVNLGGNTWKFVQNHQQVHNSTDYSILQKKNKGLLPPSPIYVYGAEWNGWKDFIGKNYFNKNEERQKQYLSYEQSRAILKKYKITSSSAYAKLRSENNELKLQLPGKPSLTYSKEWVSWKKYFGL